MAIVIENSPTAPVKAQNDARITKKKKKKNHHTNKITAFE